MTTCYIYIDFLFSQKKPSPSFSYLTVNCPWTRKLAQGQFTVYTAIEDGLRSLRQV